MSERFSLSPCVVRRLLQTLSMAKLISKPCSCHILLHLPHTFYTDKSFNCIAPRKWPLKPPNTSMSYIRASSLSNSATCNGWDDPIFQLDPDDVGSANQVQRFLISLGIDDKRFLFVYALGFLCALAISRIRVSSIIVFPAAAVAFAIGFSFGFVHGGPIKGMGLFGTKRRRAKEENFRVSGDKLKSLAEIFYRFDLKIGDLKRDIKRAIDCKSVEVSDLEGYVNAVESIALCVSDTRNAVVEESQSISNLLVDDQEQERDLNQKPSRRRKANVQNGFDFLQFVSDFARNKKKDTVSSGSKDSSYPLPPRDPFSGSIAAKKMTIEDDPDGSSRGNKIKRVLDYAKMDSRKLRDERSRKPFEDEEEELDYQTSDRFRFIDNKQRAVFKTSELHSEEIGRWASHSHMNNNLELSIRLEHKASLGEDQDRMMNIENNNNVHSSDCRRYKMEEDLVFDRYLTEANGLMKRAKESIEDEIQAEKMLHDCAELLSKAIAMKPMSLLATGQLGNTYLLHGELKLRISRQLRTSLLLLTRSSNNFSTQKRKKNHLLEELDDDDTLPPSKDRVAAAALLVDVCQECEDLLVEAGRRYRTAVSIDGNDTRSLYNWGLALSLRAQLIADIGPEAAADADKLFLAAIDKFDAMIARSNVYAPDALYRWGMALQQRSRLRPRRSAAKTKLLQQAKRLYEDAIDMGSDNNILPVREALSSCLYELDSVHI
ncbi:hypothetical protein Dimus_035205 [Dionaea muscipula]